MMTPSCTIKECGGRINTFPSEIESKLIENYSNCFEEAEKENRSWTLVGLIVFFRAYFTTGQIVPEIF